MRNLLAGLGRPVELDRSDEISEVHPLADLYPERNRDRDRWVMARRGPRRPLDPKRPHAFFFEVERGESGKLEPVATVFLTNRECPWRCVMCDLWQFALAETVPVGAIPGQIDVALASLAREAGPQRPAPRVIKLYNAGSFFDPRAIPPADHTAIAARVRSFQRVIVECHPALVGESCLRFRDRIAPAQLEVAMGLETAHPDVLAKLNKRMSLDQFRHAADYLHRAAIALRAFVLVKPPFLDEAAAIPWAERSIQFAFDSGAIVVSLIPTRGGNGALEALAGRGDFAPPRLAALEAAAEYGVSLRRGRVFADLWDLERFSDCPECLPARTARLRNLNAKQMASPPVYCKACHHGAAAPRTAPSPVNDNRF